MLALASGAAIAGCSAGAAREPVPGGAPPPEPRIVRTVSPVALADPAEFSSHLFVERDVAVVARTSGLVERVLVERGQRVKRGEALAVLESDLASAELKLAEQELRYREAEFARASTLRDDQVVSEQERLRKEIERDMTATEVELARARLERCTIRAPFDGAVVERVAVVGQRVTDDDPTALFRVVADDPLRARVDVPESARSRIARGDRAWVVVGTDPAPRSARVTFVGAAVDPASATFPVLVELDSRAGLHVGAAVSVRFDAASGAPLFRLPREAFGDLVPRSGGGATVLVADSGVAAERTVEVVELRGPDVVVRGGISLDDRVIVPPPDGIAPGRPVDARDEEAR